MVLPVFSTAGMVMVTPTDTYTVAYNKADKALYHVKQNGKCGCYFYRDVSADLTNELVDVNRLVRGIRNSGSYQGAMDVEYRQFAKLYEFVTNLEKRFDQQFSLVMITLENRDKKWGEIFSASMFIGMISAFIGYVFCDFSGVFHGDLSGLIPVCVMTVSALVMTALGLASKKKGLRVLADYALPVSLIAGMASAVPFTAWLG